MNTYTSRQNKWSNWEGNQLISASSARLPLPPKNWKQTRWSSDKTIIELGYRKISWFVSGEQINYLPQPSASANNWSARRWQITIFCSTSSNALRRVQITLKMSINITRYLYSRGPVRQVFCHWPISLISRANSVPLHILLSRIPCK